LETFLKTTLPREDPAASPPLPRRNRSATVAELALAAVLSAAAVALHLHFFVSAGPMWRDEAATLAVATSPTLHDLWTHLRFDSFPLAWEIIVRLWAAAGPGTTDQGARLFGLIVGVGIVSALWRNARRMGAVSPLASLALLEFTGITVFYGDSIRGYGLGMLLGLISFGSIWMLARSPTPARAAAALAVSMLSVHVLFYNCVWLAAACCGGLAVCAIHRRWRAAGGILAIGFLCALSMLVYLPMIRGRAVFAPVLVHPTTPALVYRQLCIALQSTPLRATIPIQKVIWATVVLAAVATAAIALLLHYLNPQEPSHTIGPTPSDLIAFNLVTLLIGIPAYVCFLIALRNYMQAWYFLAGMAMVAGCVDGLLAPTAHRPVRALLWAFTAAAAGYCFIPALHSAGVRISNIDLAADAIRASAHPDDLVILTPWWLDQPFVRHSHGPAPLVTFPPMPDLRYARYDLVVQAMSNPAAIEPVLSQTTRALQTGRRVWIVNVPWASVLTPDTARLTQPRSTWHDTEFFILWNSQLGQLLQRHSHIQAIALPSFGEVHRMENVQLLQANGWHD
jgi:hypothetical protein